MNILNAFETKQLDAFTIKSQGIESVDLMEKAAKSLLVFFLENFTDLQKPFVFFAGPGNNGGDGLALARLLNQKGYSNIKVYLFNTHNSLSPDCLLNAERLQNECPKVELTEISQQFEAPQLTPNTVIVDALFGIGLNKPLSGGFASLVQFINASQCEVISIDMPSGLMCEDNTLNSVSSIVRAKHTLTIGRMKLSQLLADNQKFLGTVHIMPLPVAEGWEGEVDCHFSITEETEIKVLLHPRSQFGHKGTFGNALLIAGRYGMAGAAILAAKACLRSGVGKVTIHTPRRNNDLLQVAVPEALLHHDENDCIITSPMRADEFDAVAIGPAIGTDKQTALTFIEQTSHTTNCPLVIDADGINILGSHKGWLQQIPPKTIFTPHPKEMQRLGICNSDSYSTLLEAMGMAQKQHFYIVLKGHFTAICTPEGNVYFNPTGNNGMATAGSGDVLTGIILSLLAQGYSQLAACRLGVYIHGLAGDIATSKLGQHSVTASDIIDYLPYAFQQLIGE